MSDFDIWDRVRETIPKFNPIVANGFSKIHFEDAEKYIDQVFRITSEVFPEGLIYKGYQRCTPDEEVKETVRMNKGGRTIELSRSSVYMLKYFFEYKGQELNPKYLWLPYVQQAGQLYMRGTLNTITPILADEGLSVSGKTIFIGFLTSKVIFERLPVSFYRNDKMFSTYCIHGKIHKQNLNKIPHYKSVEDKGMRMEHATVLYLFGKYGFFGTVEKYLGIEIHATDNEFSEEAFPRDEWFICSSMRTQPKTNKRSDWIPNDLKIAVRIKDWSAGLEGILAGLFYVADHFPHRVKAPYLDVIDMWRIVLASAIFRAHFGEGKLLEETDKHFASVDNYLDDVLKLSLERRDIFVNDIYDLFMYLVENLVHIVIHADVGTMYGKTVTVLRYVLANVIEGINKFKFAMLGTKKRDLQAKDIARELGKALQVDAFFKTKNQNSPHSEITAIQAAGDNIMFNYTAKVIQQEDATRRGKKKNSGTTNKPDKLYHVSINEIGSVAYNPKFDLTGRSVLNPYQLIGKDGVTRPNPEFKKLLGGIRKLTRAE